MLNEFDFGLIQAYIDDPLITDVNYNGSQLWIDHLKKGRYAIEGFEAHEFMLTLVYKIANLVNLPFNIQSPVIEAETKELRISILHNSVARGGMSLSIRKTPSVCRLHDAKTGIHTYAPKSVIDYLHQSVKKHKNIMISGLPGSGKTEMVKYLMESIPPQDRVITIEDTLELRYGDMYPYKDHVMIKVKELFDYEKAIKSSLRQRPDWICISEVRGHEIIHLLQSVSTGTSLISTIHAESAYAIPFRMMVMMPGAQLTNQSLNTLIHDTVDVGVHLEVVSTVKGITRRIREVVAYSIDENQNSIKEPIYDRKTKHSDPQKQFNLNRLILFFEVSLVFIFSILFDLNIQSSFLLLMVSFVLSPWFIKFENIYNREEKEFFELTDFLQQFVAAFKQHPKIYASLYECKNMSTSALHDDVEEWVAALEKGGFPKEHAQVFIEKYPHFIVGNLVHLMLAIEHYGSFEYSEGLELIQDDLEDWIEDTYAFKQSQQSTKRRIELLSFLSLVIAFFSHSMLFKARSLELTGFYQLSLVAFLLMILFTLLMAHKALSSGWIDQREMIWRKA